jgi:diaminobutyrate-2-oxoglutarate transaminase
MMQGLSCKTGVLAKQISQTAFRNGLVIETSGSESEVIKCLAPLTIEEQELDAGLDILEKSVHAVLQQHLKQVS